jgi:hypothetical protein
MVLHRSAPDQTIHPFRDRASLGRVLLWILAALIWPILAALTVPGSSADFVLPFLLVPVAVGFSAFSRYRMLRDTTWAFTQDSFTRILRGATLQSTEWGEVEILRPNRRRGRLRFSGDVDFELVARGRTSGEIRIAFPLSQTRSNISLRASCIRPCRCSCICSKTVQRHSRVFPRSARERTPQPPWDEWRSWYSPGNCVVPTHGRSCPTASSRHTLKHSTWRATRSRRSQRHVRRLRRTRLMSGR